MVSITRTKASKRLKKLLGALYLFSFSAILYAQTSIAILDFELSDVTLAPNIPAEISRTTTIKGMLEGELQRAGYKIIVIDKDSQIEANSGFGYLFNHNDVAADLAEKAGADYFLVDPYLSPNSTICCVCLLTYRRPLILVN
jgi:Protein of unknown function (DUF2380)